MSTYSDASLIFYPSGYKESKLYSLKPTDGSGDLTFTRASSATRVNEQGLIEGVITNLALRSEEFDNAVWAGTVGVTKLANQAIAPDGTNTMDLITFPLSNSSISQGINVVSGQPYTFSVWLSTQSGTVDAEIGNVNVGVYQSVTVTTTPTRFTITQNASAATRYPSIRAINPCSLLVWGGQLQEGSSATEYIKTEGTAVSVGMLANVPRIDYTSGCGKLLLEPQRTNLQTQSNGFLSNWTINEVTTSVGESTLISGETTTLITETAVNAVHRVVSVLTVSLTIGSVYTISFYAKSNGTRNIGLRTGFTGSSANIIFNPNTQTAVSVPAGFTTNITAANDGYYRYSITATSGVASDLISVVMFNGTSLVYTGTSESIYISAIQTEQGSYPTSYIPTTSTAVTKVADISNTTGLSSIMGQTTGSIYFEFSQINQFSNEDIFAFDADNSNYIRFRTSGAGALLIRVNNAGSISFATFINPIVDNTKYKILIRYANGDFRVEVNGVRVLTETYSFNTSVTYDKLLISAVTGSNNAKISGVQLYKTFLSDAEAIALTTI